MNVFTGARGVRNTPRKWLNIAMHPRLEQLLSLHLPGGVSALPTTLRPLVDALDRTFEELQYSATHDPLTGMANRALLVERITQEIARTTRQNDYRFAVLMVGLDRFKVVNDSIGHAAGDLVLQQFARRLRECVRPADTVARVGGDQFGLLLEGVATPEQASQIARRIQAELSRPFFVDTLEIFATSSIGIVISADRSAALSPAAPMQTPEELLRDVEIAMHHAKASGKGTHKVFDANMHAAVMRQLQLETDLRRAIDRDEFEVHYQPIVCLHTGKIDSVEALVRWRHPDRGLVPPGEFIPVAEETGLIAEVERIVMARACRQVAAWNSELPPRLHIALAVNLSARRFMHDGLVNDVLGLVGTTGLPLERLKLEITETVIMDNPERAVEMLAALKSHGIRISLDDFGTGYSSLSYLHRFPIDVLKVDRSFVQRIQPVGPAPVNGAAHVDLADPAVVTGALPPSDDEIVRTVVGLAHNLDLSAVAEGIETEAQLDRLRNVGCEFGQGYYFSRPLPAAAMGELLLHHTRARRAA